MKEVLSKEATKKNITIKITHSKRSLILSYMHSLLPTGITDDSAAHMIKLIHPRLEEQLMLAKNVQLIEALQELKVHEKDVSFLSPQCQFILGKILSLLLIMDLLFLFLENASLLQEEIKRQPAMIDRYYGKEREMKEEIDVHVHSHYVQSHDVKLLFLFFHLHYSTYY